MLDLDLQVSDVIERPTKVIEELEKKFGSKTRDQWMELFEGSHFTEVNT